jgi:predicted nuclease of predicted toxin-antitoxin system
VRFLADESCDFAIVRALRSAGFDVAAVVDISPRALDQAVIDMAVQQDRILVTEEKDFGQLVYASGQPSAGVILLRFPAGVRSQMAAAVLELLRRYGDTLAGGLPSFSLAVVESPGTRLRRRGCNPRHVSKTSSLRNRTQSQSDPA